MGEIHQHLHQQQQEEEQQKKTMSEARPYPMFSVNHNHHYYNYQQHHQIFHQLQNLPTTHELLHYQPHFQAYLQQQHQERTLQYQQSALTQDDFGNMGGIPPDRNENGRINGILNEDDEALQQHVPDTRCTVLAMSNGWQNREDSSIRQTFWKPFCTDLSKMRNKRGIEAKDKEERPDINQNKEYGYDEETEQNNSLEAGKSRLFGELEAICGHAGTGSSNQSGFGSSLNGENLAKSTCLPLTLDESNNLNANAMALAAARLGHHDHGSEASAGEEPSSRAIQKSRKRKKMKDEMGSMAHFFERLVKQLMNHQEVLYKKFVEMFERIDKERKERDEAGRRQELEKLRLEVAAKAHERALTSSREASIVAYLEKITGQSIKLPPGEPPLESQPEISVGNVNELSTSNRSRNVDSVMSKRWPKAEVQALIQIRSRLESRFQEPGLKGSLWEEISNSMTSMGFHRSAKRCKEKWENINKYFKKSKENPKERRHMLKTCEYFDQLGQLYSKSNIDGCYDCSSSSAELQFMHSDDAADQEKGNEELPSNYNQETPNIGQAKHKSPYMDFEGSSYEKFGELQQDIHAKKNDKHEADEDIGQVEEEREGEEGDNEGELGEEVD